jgi:hypothetical protein
MPNTTLAAILTDLKRYAQIPSSEAISDSDLEAAIQDAVSQHNAAYTATSSSCSVPVEEKFPVVLFSWSLVSVLRASARAGESSGGGPSGFNSDRQSPFAQLMKLANDLKTRYAEACKSLGLSKYAGSGVPVMSEVTCENLDLGVQTPVEMAIPLPAPILSSANQVAGNGELVLSWEFKDNSNFSQYVLFHLSGSSAIYENWNYDSTSGVPLINNNASNLMSTNRMERRATKVLNLSATQGTINRFLLVAVSKSGKYSYSNEVVITQS